MDQYELVRTAHRVYKKGIRQIAWETGHTRRTIRKVLAGQGPKYRREKEPACPVMDPVAGIVEGWLRADRDQPVKQRHTAHRVWRRLVDEHGFTGAEPTVRRWVRERKMRLGWHRPTAVVPLDPEQAREAEVDWGTAWVRMNGQDRIWTPPVKWAQLSHILCPKILFSILIFDFRVPYPGLLPVGATGVKGIPPLGPTRE